ncbi:hypothetical protein WDZ16_09160 [Pseudokineococcus marinus]|uniref:ARB-07466-like C-terminal domain-containing protein n=1 Tax=Pseudokineococcus marinus TaxID=351215 RepID=A0A849BNU2_9ACTN|nr:hypothetical protein [Pseudokineococcus marinus]NNH22492.1 hypothetical protein [Pseudokineococcus marinus]
MTPPSPTPTPALPAPADARRTHRRTAGGAAAAVLAALLLAAPGAPALAAAPAPASADAHDAAHAHESSDAHEQAVRASMEGPDVDAPGADVLAPAALAAAPVPRPVRSYSGSPEALAKYVAQVSCDPVERPGTVAFRDLLDRTYGANAGGITRNCNSGVTEHSDGRAYDWMLDANRAADAEKAATMIQWLVGPDAQGVTAGNARRLGVMYIIWDRKIWGSYNGVWKAYNGSSPHRDHVHFSLSWDGAMGRTSFWTGATLQGHDYGPCRLYAGEPVPKYSGRNTSPCPTPGTRPAVAPVSPITAKWGALGGESGVLGRATTAEQSTPAPREGRYRHFAGGSLYDSPTTEASLVRGTIRDHWAGMGFERSPLGFPTTDEARTPDGKGAYSHFQGGSVYSTAATGAHDVRGGIRDRWAAMGWERSVLGYPTSDETRTPDGRGAYSHFQGGSIYATDATGSHDVRGAIRSRWASLGWERGALGYPTSDVLKTSTGLVSHFQGGSIRWVTATRTTVVELD